MIILPVDCNPILLTELLALMPGNVLVPFTTITTVAVSVALQFPVPLNEYVKVYVPDGVLAGTLITPVPSILAPVIEIGFTKAKETFDKDAGVDNTPL
ncbi:hypothetical protein D3C86_1669770 [compost metagenome]